MREQTVITAVLDSVS